MKTRAGITTKNMLMHLLSAKIKDRELEKIRKNAHTGREIKKVKIMPAEITFLAPTALPSARYFVISLETVMGVPDEVIVKSKAKTERAT